MTEVLGYCRRVSFNNVHPDDDLLRFYSYSFHEPTLPTDPPRFFGNYSLTSHKRLKLPDPPSKSILKNKLSQQQLKDNLDRARSLGVSYHGDINDLADFPPDSVPRLEVAVVCVEDGADDDGPKSPTGSSTNSSSSLQPPPPPPTGGRRKSYLGMSDEELMALDPQFNTPRTSDISSFKFDSQQTYYKNSPRRSSAVAATTVVSQAKQVIYPLLNENNYPSISLTAKHEDYDHNILTARKLMTVLSGRKHTWNSLDWLLQTNKEAIGPNEPGFLQSGDYLIVAALVPLKYFNANTTRKKNALEDKLYKKCEHLLDYILHSLPDKLLCLKVTVEFVIDVPPADPMTLTGKRPPPVGTKFMVDHLFKQYLPNLVILGNKSTNLNFKYPMRKMKSSLSASSGSTPSGQGFSLSKFHLAPQMSSGSDEHEVYLIKLTSYVIKYSPVPVIIVGTHNTAIHKKNGTRPLLVTFSDQPLGPKITLDVPQRSGGRKPSTTSTASIESYAGPQDGASVCSLDESLQHINMGDTLADLMSCLSESKFQDMLSVVSQCSLTELRNYLTSLSDTSKNPEAKLNSKVHQAYQSYSHTRTGVSHLASRTLSNSSDGKPYKVKSMISYSEEEERKNEKKLNDKRLKKSVSQSSNGLASSGDKKVKKKKSFLQKIGFKK